MVADHAALPAVDGIIVATPAVTHFDIVSALIRRAVPVLVAKPFTTDTAEAELLARQGAGRLFVGHTWRYHPGVQLLGEIARSGEIGPIVGLRRTRTNWTSPRTDVDSIWNLAPHDLTLAIEILGGIPEARSAVAELHDGRAVGMTALLGDDALARVRRLESLSRQAPRGPRSLPRWCGRRWPTPNPGESRSRAET